MGIFNNLIGPTSDLKNPQTWFRRMFQGTQTSSGVSVTEDNAMNITAVYAAQKIIFETIASLPLPLYKRLDGGGKERAPNHYLYSVLHDQANEEMTAFTFVELMQHHLLTWGNAYAEKEINGAGQVVGLWPLNPARTTVERNKETGRLEYFTATPDGIIHKLPRWKVFHISTLGDGILGKSPIRLHREAIGLAKATEEFGARFFSNGATPSGIVEYPGRLSDEAFKRFRDDMREQHNGLSKSHKLMILEEGLKYHQVGIPQKDAQFLETRKFQLNEIARIYRVPPHKIGDLERSTNNNIEHQSIEFVVDTIRPWLVRWEQAIKMQLLTKSARKTYFAEFLIDGLLRGDIKTRYEAYRVGRNDGWLSADDIREKENMNPLPDGLGKTYLINGNMIPIDKAAKGGEDN
ncbi:phage portal protein [Radiobacillus kanasensis]|uniref:phage portal protein n=1 Tax=Radiobacillus kanasensis TaxID=2844358 RepID=UPI001E5FC3A6|nr:phage portal protein [Radiobacillus kanasensis]UFT98099.1 phage portal protein [Radiobacillus kanasensis]